MPSTTVHIPDRLLSRIDQAVKEQNISRNRFILQACEDALTNMGGRWPNGFFDVLEDEGDVMLLREALSDMERIIFDKRKSRKRTIL
ncbi:MAG: ribbon-helix-helix protein, CopG family [Deltaproteobacteria bacterium]|nr:ribbon-helix-helix protein, CopG family [Deltaproteobacteria bacterium]